MTNQTDNSELKNKLIKSLDTRINTLLSSMSKEDRFAERIYILLSKHCEAINEKSIEEKDFFNSVLKYILFNSDIYRKNIIENAYFEISNTIKSSCIAVDQYSNMELYEKPIFDERKNYFFSSFSKDVCNQRDYSNNNDKCVDVNNVNTMLQDGVFINTSIDNIRKTLIQNELPRISLSNPLPDSNDLFSFPDFNDEENISNSKNFKSNLLSCISKVSSVKLNKKPFSQKDFISNLKSPSPVSQKISTKKFVIKSATKKIVFDDEK